MPLWNYNIQNVVKKSDGQDEVGVVYEQKRPHDTNLYKVIEFRKPESVKVELQPPKPLQQYGFELHALIHQTQVVYKWQVDLRKYKLLKFIPDGVFKNWILSFARNHTVKNIKPATEQNFLKLKELLEKGKVTLQDGRIISLPK